MELTTTEIQITNSYFKIIYGYGVFVVVGVLASLLNDHAVNLIIFGLMIFAMYGLIAWWIVQSLRYKVCLVYNGITGWSNSIEDWHVIRKSNNAELYWGFIGFATFVISMPIAIYLFYF